MNDEMEMNVGKVFSYLDNHGPTPLIELSRELGSVVRAVVAVSELSYRGLIQIVEQDAKTLMIKPRQRSPSSGA